MTIRKDSFKLGVAVALTFGMAATAIAQTSTTRIPVRKDADPMPRVDTVTVYRTDTLRVFRTDTLRMPGQTTVRYDTTRVETIPAYLIQRGGMYFGLAGGISYPHGALERGNTTGLAGQAQLGWQSVNNPLGWRLDVNYAQPGENPQFANLGPDGDIINANLDLKLKVPFTRAVPNLSMYVIGGGSYVYYQNLKIELDPGQTTAPGNVINQQGWSDKWGWNAGGGLSVHWGKTELFTEARLISFKPENTDNARQIPWVIGVNWY